MIKRIWSDLPSFREVYFQAGMNIILADRTEDSSEKESTNGLGKTTLIRVVHFCFGSDFARDKVLNHPDLKDVTFGVDFEFKDNTFTAYRNTSSPKTVTTNRLFISNFSCDYELVDTEYVRISLEDWKDILSEFFYPESKIIDDVRKYEPSFRELTYYLMRVGKEAYTHPDVAFGNQPGASRRLCPSFLLGLNWESQRNLQNELDHKKQIKAAIQHLGQFQEISGGKSIGELEAERVVIATKLQAKQTEVENFNLREDYRDLEKRLNDVDQKIHALINENHSDSRLRDFYEKSSEEIPIGEQRSAVEILQEAGAIFREDALQNLEDVSRFHSEVYSNRKAFLASEIDRLKKSILQRDETLDALSSEKTQILQVLKTSGAIETLIELQKIFVDLKSRYEVLTSQIEERKRFDRQEDEIANKISQERILMKRDLEDRQEAVDGVRALFARYTQDLYGEPGGLGVDVSNNGYKFSFAINREGSDGVDQMVVFCFDLTVATLWARKENGFHVLFHDSSLFADVDPRQYAGALKLAAKTSQSLGFQYICCLNSGSLPKEYFGDFNLDSYVRLRLTDNEPEGSLLGKRLPPREMITSGI